MKSFRVIGLMSGTSLDGLDVADVTFAKSEFDEWSFSLNHSAIYEFSEPMLAEIKSAFHLASEDLMRLSANLGRFYAEKVNCFLNDFKIDKSQVDFIASHGQTIFHQPQRGYTLQIGNGPELAVFTGLPTVVDFRSKDVALGGNGAPLIPVADHLLFSKYADTFLNLGGFSNFSYKENNEVFSYDICPVNIVLNELMAEIGEEFDEGGEYGRQGEVNFEILNALNSLTFYEVKGPKSLGWEWVVNEIHPLLQINIPLKDKVRTLYEHMAIQIGSSINRTSSQSTLITGGGAKNSFLIDRIQNHTNSKVIVPEEALIDFKEAIGFAFLGLLKWSGEINVWSTVTGAERDSCSGSIIRP